MLFSRMRRASSLVDKLAKAHKESSPVSIRFSFCRNRVFADINNVILNEIGYDYLGLERVLVRLGNVIVMSQGLNAWTWDAESTGGESDINPYRGRFVESLYDLRDAQNRVYVLAYFGCIEEIVGTIHDVGVDCLTVNTIHENRITIRDRDILLVGSEEDVQRLKEVGSYTIYNLLPDSAKRLRKMDISREAALNEPNIAGETGSGLDELDEPSEIDNDLIELDNEPVELEEPVELDIKDTDRRTSEEESGDPL